MFKSNSSAFSQISKAIEYWDEKYPKKHDPYVAPYRDKKTFDNLYSFYASLTQFVGAKKDSIGCDLGCWLGFPCLLEADSCGGQVIGIEIQERFTEQAREWLNIVGNEQVSFDYMHGNCVPLTTGSMDWVFINQVLCNALQDSFDKTIEEAVRILKPGGILVISDSNNPYTPAVKERLYNTYRTVEIGNGTQESPNGSMFRVRVNRIKKLDLELTDAEIKNLAKYTCYLWGTGIEKAALRYKVENVMPTSRFIDEHDQPPINATTGTALGNFTNPFHIAKLVEKHGLQTSVSTALTFDQSEPAQLKRSFAKNGSFFVISKK